MASIRDLKKIVNFELSEVIEYAYVWQLIHADKATKGEEVIDSAIEKFDDLIGKINLKNISNKKEHFRAIKQDLSYAVAKLHEQLKNL